jgi:hypothetical protein
MAMNFQINPTDYLGHDHEVFRTKLMELALSEPKKYFELRRDVLTAVKKQAVDDAYNTYYHLLTTGQQKDGSTLILNGANSIDYVPDGFKPNMPRQKVNKFALKAAKTLDAIAEECIEMLLPQDYRQIAENRTVQKTASNLGFP